MSALAGLTVLIVEDEPIVAMMVEDMLEELGCAVAGSAANVDEGLSLAGQGGFDIALLDVNLNGRRSDPIAEALARSGTPFIYATGYGAAAVEAEHGERVLQKPYTIGQLADALRAAAGRRED
jgi:CheY-like chemotaxis protein